MKLFSLLAGCAALVHAAEDATWQDASDADVKTWKTDVLHAQDTMKDIKNKQCQLPKGKSLKKLGDPSKVMKHFYKLSNGNTRSTYQFRFKDGTMVYAGNSNVGEKGGMWKVMCYRQGHDVATRTPHAQNDLDSATIKKLRDAFNRVDKDGSGTITTGGAYTALSMIFGPTTLPHFEDTLEKESIKAAGKDKVVDMSEFECVAKKLYNIKKVYAEFKQYDKNKDMKMDRKELESALIKFYFKGVAKPGLIQTAAMRTQVKKTVDAIIKRHDKNKDNTVSWEEFEMDAFLEEHYKLGAKCATSTTPLNKHEITVVENLIKKFGKKGAKKELSHSSWYQITSMLTEKAIDAMNGAQKGPALGCRRMPGQSGGGNRGNGNGNTGNHPVLVGGRALLSRMLQAGPVKVGAPTKGKPTKPTNPKMSVMQALMALHKDADANNDGVISDHEILKNFQGVRNHLSASDFGQFLDMVNKIKGPVNCGMNKDCGKCTAVANAGLCGWYMEVKTGGGAFGGYSKTSKGNCKFVDRSKSSDHRDGTDNAHGTTCSTQCHARLRGNSGGRKPVE